MHIYIYSGTKLHIMPTETALKRSAAPVVATFSSRGPSSISPHFLKVLLIIILLYTCMS